MARSLALIASLVVPALTHPTYIGCDLKVIGTKSPSGGHDIMTTTEIVMGQTPADKTDLVTASATEFVKGGAITLTFHGDFQKGFVHANSGTFTAPEFTGTADANAATCTDTQTIKYKFDQTATAAITWTADSSSSVHDALNTVVLSFAAAPAWGQIRRQQITLQKSSATAAPTTAAPTTAAPTTAAPTAAPTTAAPTTAAPTAAPTTAAPTTAAPTTAAPTTAAPTTDSPTTVAPSNETTFAPSTTHAHIGAASSFRASMVLSISMGLVLAHTYFA